jgi:hypothetical protein
MKKQKIGDTLFLPTILITGIAIPLILTFHHINIVGVQKTMHEGIIFLSYWIYCFPHLALLIGCLMTGFIQKIIEVKES